MKCSKVAPILSAYLDEELAPWQMWRVAQHLGRCEECVGQLASLSFVRSALSGLEQPAPRAGFWPLAYARAARTAARSEARRPILLRRPGLAWATTAAAAVATLLLAFPAGQQDFPPGETARGREAELRSMVKEHASLKATTPFPEEGRIAYILTEDEDDSPQ